MTMEEMIDTLRGIADDFTGEHKEELKTSWDDDALPNVCRNVANRLEEWISQKTIYVITKGSYSDYGICAVTTDKARAEELKLLYSDRYDDANIEEYEDGHSGFSNDVKIVHPYRVAGTKYCIDNNLDIDVHQYTELLEPGNTFEEERSFMIDGDDPNSYLVLYILAPDEEHAKKVWYDTWAQLNAERLGL